MHRRKADNRRTVCARCRHGVAGVALPSPGVALVARRVTVSSATANQKKGADAHRKRRVTSTKRATIEAHKGPIVSKARPSPMHDAVRRDFQSSDEHGELLLAGDHASECEQLREQLQRVLFDHQRQADEIVALRALARSLREEAETMKAHQDKQDNPTSPFESRSNSTLATHQRHARSHEFFQLDAQLDDLRTSNVQLQRALAAVEEAKKEADAFIARELPRYEMQVVLARAELESVASQLLDERAQNNVLRAELACCQARGSSPVRLAPARRLRQDGALPPSLRARGRSFRATPLSAHLGRQGEQRCTGEEMDENDHDHRDRLSSSDQRSLGSSVHQFSLSLASATSSHIQDDLDALKNELSRLHRSIDASVSVVGSNNRARNDESKG